MSSLNTLLDLKRALKPLGFGVRTKTFSFGPAATYVMLSTKQPLPDMFFKEEDRAAWKPLVEFLQAHYDELKALGKAEGISGLAQLGKADAGGTASASLAQRSVVSLTAAITALEASDAPRPARVPPKEKRAMADGEKLASGVAKLLAPLGDKVKDKGTGGGYRYEIDTPLGKLKLTTHAGSGDSIFASFDDEKLAARALGSDVNPHSGKWNIHAGSPDEAIAALKRNLDKLFKLKADDFPAPASKAMSPEHKKQIIAFLKKSKGEQPRSWVKAQIMRNNFEESVVEDLLKQYFDSAVSGAVDTDDDDEKCRTGGGPNDDGEGWDGECGNCVDKPDDD